VIYRLSDSGNSDNLEWPSMLCTQCRQIVQFRSSWQDINYNSWAFCKFSIIGCLSNALDRPSNQFFSVCLCVCEQIGCRTITSTVLYRFSPNFACGSEMWLLRRMLFVRQTGSTFPILEVCGFRFRQFSGSGDHIFQQMNTKCHIQIKLSNVNIVFNGEWNQR